MSEEDCSSEYSFTSNSSGSYEVLKIRQYRTDYESDEHWEIKKSFIETHWENFASTDEIVALANVFCNSEFLKCKYPSEVRARVEALAQDIPEVKDYRERRRHRRKEVVVEDIQEQQEEPVKSPEVKKDSAEDWNEEEKTALADEEKLNWDHLEARVGQRGLLMDVVYFEVPNDPAASLNKTITFMKKVGKLEKRFDYKNKKFLFLFNGEVIAQADGANKKFSQTRAEEELIKTLKANCYTIRSKQPTQQQDENDMNAANTGEPQEESPARKLLELLRAASAPKEVVRGDDEQMAPVGAEGAAEDDSIEKKPEGDEVIDDVNMTIQIQRKDLPSNPDGGIDLPFVKKLLENYSKLDVEHDLKFSRDLTCERFKIQRAATKMKLQARTAGMKKSCHIVVHSKLKPQVLRQRLIEGDERLLRKYEIIPPPENTFKLRKRYLEKKDDANPNLMAAVARWIYSSSNPRPKRVMHRPRFFSQRPPFTPKYDNFQSGSASHHFQPFFTKPRPRFSYASPSPVYNPRARYFSPGEWSPNDGNSPTLEPTANSSTGYNSTITSQSQDFTVDELTSGEFSPRTSTGDFGSSAPAHSTPKSNPPSLDDFTRDDFTPGLFTPQSPIDHLRARNFNDRAPGLFNANPSHRRFQPDSIDFMPEASTYDSQQGQGHFMQHTPENNLPPPMYNYTPLNRWGLQPNFPRKY